jgi:UDP-N-acetylmuramate--alanine ligase
MRALAEYLLDAGWTLSGSDDSAIPPLLAARGVVAQRGHSASALPASADLVIHSSAVPADNPELRAAKLRNWPVISYAQALGALSRGISTICVAGTHGKSTTAALTAHLLETGGCAPSAIVGAESIGRQRSGWKGSGDLLVLESCEYRRHFLGLCPQDAIVTGIEAEHFDCYPDREAALAAFGEFVALIPPRGTLVLPVGDPEIWSLVQRTEARIVTVGIDSTAEWNAAALRAEGTGIRFELQHCGRPLGTVSLRIPGRHNVWNALAAGAIAHCHGVAAKALIAGLGSFPGIRRRFEILRQSPQYVLIDDYAHHPTALRETLAAARQMFPGRRMLCLFQPHQIARTRRLLAEYGQSLLLADEAWIAPVFTAREANADGAVAWSERVARSCREAGGAARSFDTLDRMPPTLEDEARSGDVLLTIGAGNIHRIHHELIGRLFGNSEAG